jgi:hypothetical protein
MRERSLFLLVFLLIPFFSVAQQATYDVTPGNGNGIRFWQSDMYKIHMGNGSEYLYGPVTDYSIKHNMNTDAGRGWTWGIYGQTPVLAVSNAGHMQLAGTFTTLGNIVLPSVSGNKQIFTWSGDDNNWRIGMSATPGFARAIATTHVQYLTYHSLASQGFAVGVHSGESSFEVTGDHRAYFRGNVALATTTLNNEKLAIAGNAQWHVRMLDTNGGQNWRLGSSGNAWAAGGGKFIISNSDNSSEGSFAIDNQKRVGIGTVAPSTRLEIAGLGNSTVDLKVNGRIQTGDSYNAGGMWVNSPGTMFMGQQGASALGLYNNGAWRLIADNTGNIGIGTLSPDQKLTVKGKIHSEEVIVDLSVPAPDYVFEQNYSLTPLDEVQAYIAQYKHLPEVPSAKEMEKDGVKVGEMEMILLKKIEELTLYQIESTKRLAELEARLKYFENQTKQSKQ